MLVVWFVIASILMRFALFTLILALLMVAVVAKPRTPEATREARHLPDKGKQKSRSNPVPYVKRANPNADLLYLDQLIL
ncbi:hypothetical protein Q1695_006524 [Nippostrongylus brasiliensis]|nr:hypothetical protein Q1695_006524 [Nippostrongylus brasiliensis]